MWLTYSLFSLIEKKHLLIFEVKLECLPAYPRLTEKEDKESVKSPDGGRGIQSYSYLCRSGARIKATRRRLGTSLQLLYCCALKKSGEGLRQRVKVYGLNIAKM